jgi:hypothetical protein
VEDQFQYKFPILTIQKVRPLLKKEEIVFSYSIVATTQSGKVINLYENAGLNLVDYVGQKMECLLEITRGEFKYPSNASIKLDNCFIFKYQWQKRIYEYFPELRKISNDLDNANPAQQESLQALFDQTATNFFTAWGLNGLQLGIYQDKPLLSSPDGFFLLNEYEFENDIEELELDQEVHIRIDEAFLRGIRPCVSSDIPVKQLHVLKQPEKEEPIADPLPQPDPSEKKKARSRFFID